MRIYIDIKKTVIVASSKDALLLKLAQYGHYTCSSDGTYLSNFNSDLRTVYNCYKVRRKTIQIRDNKGKYKSSKVIRNTQWIANLYRFPKSILFKVYQKHNTFVVKCNKVYM